jgi:hypothetical protein
MGQALDRLAELASKDEEMSKAIREYHTEVICNIVNIVVRWTEKLFPEGPDVSVNIPETNTRELPCFLFDLDPRENPKREETTA